MKEFNNYNEAQRAAEKQLSSAVGISHARGNHVHFYSLEHPDSPVFKTKINSPDYFTCHGRGKEFRITFKPGLDE